MPVTSGTLLRFQQFCSLKESVQIAECKTPSCHLRPQMVVKHACTKSSLSPLLCLLIFIKNQTLKVHIQYDTTAINYKDKCTLTNYNLVP